MVAAAYHEGEIWSDMAFRRPHYESRQSVVEIRLQKMPTRAFLFSYFNQALNNHFKINLHSRSLSWPNLMYVHDLLNRESYINTIFAL